MPANQASPSQPPKPIRPQPSEPTRPASFAALARRISGWTSNLLATGIILILTLVVGKQLVVWWHVEPGGAGEPAPAAVPLADIGASGPLELGFGNMPYQLQCRKVRSDGQAATEALVATCRDLAAAGDAVLPDFGSAEAGLLKLAAQATPVARGPGEIEVFASHQGMPLVVVTRRVKSGGKAATGHSTDEGHAAATKKEPAEKLGAGERRVVTWGLAVSAAEGEWNLYVAHASRSFQPAASSPDEARSQETGSRDAVPIPPGSRRSLAVWDARGGGLSAFAGSGRAADWVAFYSSWFGRKPWVAVQPWQPVGDCWHARYERAGSWGRETVDVQFGPAGQFAAAGVFAADSQLGSPDGQSANEPTGLVGLISIAGAEPPAGK